VVGVLLRSFLAVALDEEGARVAGLPVSLLNATLSVLAALTIGISMRVVGILLIAALMVVPVIAAQRIAWSLRSTMAISIVFGLVAVLAGLSASYYVGSPPGGTIVLAATALFLAAWAAQAVRAGSVR
jgi:zinc transport system permease protein